MFPARRSIAALPGLLAAFALGGCPRPGTSADAGEGGAAPARADAGADASAGDGAPPPLKLEVRYQAPDAGLALIDFVPGGDRPSIEPTSQLEVSTNIGLQNYRVRLFDEIDRAMTSDDQMEEPGDTMRYRIQLPTPLKAGHRYALVLDAQTGSAIADSAGRLYPDQRLEFTIAGAREPDSSKKTVRTKPDPRQRVPGKPKSGTRTTKTTRGR